MDADRSKTDPVLMRPPDQHLVDVVLACVTERLALTEAPIDGFGTGVKCSKHSKA